MTAMSAAGPERAKRRASPLDVAKTVLSAFFGVRRRAHHEAAKVTPVQLIVAALIAGALFVAALLLLANFIVSRYGPGA